MVHFAGSGSHRWQHSMMNPLDVRVPAGFEIEDSIEDEHGPLNKRLKHQSPISDPQLSTGNDLFTVFPMQYNPLDEPSPLGLRLRKSPSLLEMIQMTLSQGKTSKPGYKASDNVNLNQKSFVKNSAGNADKLKAANFPASLLKIGDWEYVSRYEGDLVAKCYFAKHKLVWEILDGGLKSKIEIQWADIMGLKANIPEDGPATLIIALARQPLFFRETNPQPRKHTLWQATSDFSNGHASLHRQHFLQVPNGLLNKHFEKLIQSDARLDSLSQQAEIILDSPFFGAPGSILNDSSEVNNLGLDQKETGIGSSTSESREDTVSPMMSTSSIQTMKEEDIISRIPENVAHDAPSPNSGMVIRPLTGHLPKTKSWEHLITQGLHRSMSMAELVNHIENCISEASSSAPPGPEKESESHKMLKNLADYLLSDSHSVADCSDEKSLLSRVNSLCCLLQDTDPKPELENENQPFCPNTENMQQNVATFDRDFSNGHGQGYGHEHGCGHDLSSFNAVPTMSRKDSFSDLLLHLPRIASFPKFLLDISEDELF
ncbi:hypothetical protein AKJ16_DCAP08373 [Drosera capensis]